MAVMKQISANGVTTGTTAVTVVPAIAVATYVYRLRGLTITNRDTANGVVIVRVDDNGTKREIRRVSLNAGVAATGVLTFTGNAVGGETLVIGTKTYTWEVALADTDGHVDVGVDQATSEDNITSALNLGAGSGSKYAASMAAHAEVGTAVDSGATVTVPAIATGAAGNGLATTEAMTNASFGGSTMSGGVDPDSAEITDDIIFDTTTRTLEILLGWPVVTTEFDYVVSYSMERP